jgi:aerotolerance regulator-like protein
VTFAAGWALAALVLLAPLVLLHLRRRGQVVREVPSLLLWEQIELVDAKGSRGLRRPPLPLLLLLQALALALLVFALAEPISRAPAAKPAQVLVLDDSWQMQAPGRMAEATREAERILAADPPATPVAIVLANGSSSVLYRGARAGALATLARVSASAAPADLASALTVAAGLLGGAHDSLALIRAPEDPLPAVSAAPGELQIFTLSPPIGDQGIFDAGARCGLGASATCEVYATVRNTAAHAVDELVSADADGHPPVSVRVQVAADASAPLFLVSQPGEQVSLRLQGSDPLPADDEAWVTVPAAGDLPKSSVVTLVGTPSTVLATARAFAAVPGVSLRLRTSATFTRGDAEQSDLVVLDHLIPRGGLPPSPAVLLVDPPRLPEGRVGGALGETVVSGTDAGNELLEGVELSSLAIAAHAAIGLNLPPWLAPVVWSPDGALLAAGSNGRQRVATLAFEPGQSNLTQLPALPILAANLVRWAAGWAPVAAKAGVPFTVEAASGIRTVTLEQSGAAAVRARVTRAPVVFDPARPGLYSVRETGPGTARSALVTVNTAEASPVAPTPVDLLSARVGGGSRAPVNRAFWFLLAALLVLGLEWAYWVSHRRRAGL